MNGLLRYPLAYCVVGIVLAATFEDVRAEWLGLAVLGTLISLYGFLGKGAKDESRFEIGDNCYFIGFVYTLSIITASLVFDAEDLLSGARDSLHPLLKTVGIALGTSVVGMLWRFGLTHDIRVGEDAFHEAVREASVAAAALKGVVGELRQAVATAASTIDAQANASSAKLDQVVRTALARIEDAAADTAGALQTLGEHTGASLRGQAKSVATVAEGTAQALGGLQQAAKTSTETLAPDLAAASAALRGYARTVDEAAGRVGDALADGARDALARVSQGVAEALQANTFADAREAMETAVQAHRQAVAEVSRTLRESLSGLNEATALATARAREARQALEAADGALERAGLDAATASVAALRDAVTALNRQLPALAANQDAAAKAASDYRGELDSLHRALAKLPPLPALAQRQGVRWWHWRRWFG